VFRDHTLSDRIGFVYSGWAPEVAADDFVARLVEAGRRYTAAGGEEALLPVILDGENAWEHFEGGGRPFLRALYRRLSNHPHLRTVTMAEACADPGPTLDGIFPGSWIDANFSIWIGHRDDQLAWGQLADARHALDTVSDADPNTLEQAREEVLIAEGSDWFWWYGDDHSSDHDAEFDDLFRRHLRNVYRLLHKPVPEELFISNISTGTTAPEETPPLAWLAPTIDGEETSYFEWLGAGTLDGQSLQGAMHQTTPAQPVLTRVHFGFDPQHLFVRLDAGRPVADLLAEEYVFSLTFLQPANRRLDIRGAKDTVVGVLSDQPSGTPGWIARGAHSARVAAGTILELAVPLDDLGAQAGEPVAFFVSVSSPSRAGLQETERYPAQRPIRLVVPGERFSGENWRA
jgi:Glycosyl hydrolase family 57